ncbi:cullin-9-like isoform X2 [Cyrtonyx montezumae]|uniref:cullin-9-like isoform X2 n=1 Tax=Cyrtonyx montezumae TaxID=9017 RepID=UPI0032DBD3C3
MASERREGALLVRPGPQLQAYPHELLRRRRGPDGAPEYLVRWRVEERAASGSGGSPAGPRSESVAMWLSAEEVRAGCPALLGGGEREKEDGAPGPPPAALDEASLLEMKADVGSLVRRAGRQLAGGGTPVSSVLNTVHVLSAYAGIGALAGAFRETGALDLLLEMLCHEEKAICHGAGEMLRALALHDAGSWAYVLLSLSQQDGIEQHMDFDGRYTLLELFAETTSSEDHCVSFEGIPLPQIPGKQLFTLVKRYLCVTSLLDKLSSDEEESGEQQESSHVKQEFEFSMAMANLILELARVMGWDHSHKPEPPSQQETKPYTSCSIFQHQSTSSSAAPAPPAPRPNEPSTFKTRSAFPSRSSYVEYVQANLVHGMRVRMLEDYEQVSAGDEGEFRQSNDGMPPVQVYWYASGCTYWVHWHMVEIIGSPEQEEQEGRERVSTLRYSQKLAAAAQPLLSKPPAGLCPLPYLGEQPSRAAATLSRAEWWELLFFVKKLEAQEQQEMLQLIRQEHAEQLSEPAEDALLQLPVPVELAQTVLRALEKQLQGSAQSELCSSRVYAKCLTGSGAGQCGGSSAAVSSEGTGPGAVPATVAKEELSAATALGSDSQLFRELLEREGLCFPQVDERSEVWGGCEGVSEGGCLAEVQRVVDAILRGGCEAELRVSGLQHAVKVLEEAPEQERCGSAAQGVPGTREKLVRAAVELLGTEEAESCPAALALWMVALLMESCEWRVPFAAEGGARAVLACMRRHAASTLVQQAGLAALKLLVGAGGADGKPSLLSHTDAQTMREIFASIGSACGEGSPGLLGAIPAAVRAMQGVPGGSSGVRNGLLVAGMLVDGHRGLAEQLVGCDLPAVLQSCWKDGRDAGCPNAALALSIIDRLAEHRLLCGPEMPGTEAVLLEPTAGLWDGALPEDAVVALEQRLCGLAAVPVGEVSQRLQEHHCFRLLLHGLELPGTEKAVGLRILRILNAFLDGYREDALPWHECVEPCLSFLSTRSSDREVVQEVVGFLHRLATTNKDCTVGMCRAGAREAVAKALDEHSTALPLAPSLLELVSDCERHAALYRKLTGSVLSGCIQVVLGQIEEHRRSQQPISVPFFDVFLRNLCRGSSVEVKEDKCWEKVQVSSNPHRASKLTDRNPKTYWESNGSTGSHYITVHMQRGVVVREMSMLVSSEDSSYMPARVVVLGGDSPADVRTELNAVTVLPSASRVVLLENMPRFWPVIQIRVKRCQQGGIDTRVRGIEVLGPKPTFWPIFKEQLCRRTFLFCSARAHAWCQEIRQDRRQLLQLFGKLNRALRHEQDFAERFLPDDEVARALGRTCWEALVTPVVQSITSADSGGISPLSWLLDEYLGSVEPPRGDAFGSCVRRLTQLLVHVDPGGEDLEEARAAGGKEGRNQETAAMKSGGLWDMVRCWCGVVQQQVQQFLEVSGQAADVVERYCALYRRLRGATEELFGQQAAFVGALGQGFARALLQLSFLTALHVSEQFARYLDRKVQELHGAAGGTGQLQQVLEPFVVFGGLEFAHTFEHFYRLYLGDRLLVQGPSWLEEAVVEQMGLCFPRRFPQEMLSDLAESEELRRHFGLFQLQERDRRLLERDLESPKSPETEVPREVPAVEVLVLSPRCWPVSPLCYVEEPRRFFSAALSSPLEEFADFWRHSQSRPGRLCTRPRRLQWTWLGHAELCFGDCILHVSTLQMYILLCFNSAEEVAVDALLQVTGLPAELVHQALAPLTHGDGILVQSCTHGAPGALRLNQAALAHASGRHLRLLPRQRYLRAERAESSALERKRNVLCCLITRLLKAEKQLHIDNLVFKVIDACEKGELGPGLQFLSFCCHSVDVLSCVLHLLNQGYLRRQEERPHVLEYVSAEPPPAPSQAQPRVTFQTVEIKTAANPASAERRQTFSTFR